MKFTDKAFLSRMYDTIASIERVSSVEIVSIIYPQSHNYTEQALLLGPASALLVSAYLMFSPQEFNPWFIYFVSVGIFALVFTMFFFIPQFKRLIIPKSLRKSYPKTIAHSIFSQAGICNTKERTGLLIYVSSLEKQVIIIADKGITQAVPKDSLNALQVRFNDVFNQKSPAKAFLNVLDSSKDLFAKYLPVKPDDINELPDNLFIKIKF